MIGPHKVGHRVTVYCGGTRFDGTVCAVGLDSVELEVEPIVSPLELAGHAPSSRVVIAKQKIMAVEYPGATDAV